MVPDAGGYLNFQFQSLKILGWKVRVPQSLIVFLILCTRDLGVRNAEKTFPYKNYFGGQFKRHGDVEKRGFGMLKGCSYSRGSRGFGMLKKHEKTTFRA